MKEKVKEPARTRKIDKKTIIGMVGALLAMAVVAVVIILANYQEPIPEDYFVADNTKLVLTLPPALSSFEANEDYQPEMTYVVYFYEGNKVTGAKVYFEYADEAAAREADKNISLGDKNWAIGRRRNGRYIVFSVKPEQYKNLTTDKVNENIKSYDIISE